MEKFCLVLLCITYALAASFWGVQEFYGTNSCPGGPALSVRHSASNLPCPSPNLVCVTAGEGQTCATNEDGILPPPPLPLTGLVLRRFTYIGSPSCNPADIHQVDYAKPTSTCFISSTGIYGTCTQTGPNTTTFQIRTNGDALSIRCLDGGSFVTSSNSCVTLGATFSYRFDCVAVSEVLTLPPIPTFNPNTTSPPSTGGKPPCFHVDTVITYKGQAYTLEELCKHPECSIPHFVRSRGVIITAKCNGQQKVLQLTPGHLVYTQRGLVAASNVKPHEDILYADLMHQEPCEVESVTQDEGESDYFGLNCLESQVLASGIKTSTFEKYHAIPSAWMSVMGRLLGVERASSIGDHLVYMIHRMKML